MVSINQTETVKQLEAEGWTVVPALDKTVLGAQILMQRSRGSVLDRVLVIPDGEAIPQWPTTPES